jgi:hypothetical protein
MIVRHDQIIPLTPTADHSALEGHFVKNSSGSAALIAAATEIPVGVIVDGEPANGKDSVALQGFAGVVTVKLAATPGTVNPFTVLTLDGTTLGAVRADPGTGNRVQVAIALQAGVAGELIQARLIQPVSLS